MMAMVQMVRLMRMRVMRMPMRPMVLMRMMMHRMVQRFAEALMRWGGFASRRGRAVDGGG